MASAPPPTVLVMGTFDGVHLGHRALLRLGVQRAGAIDGEAWALTFDPHPSLVLAPDLAPPLLSTLDERLERIEEESLDAVVIVEFDERLASTGPEEFMEDCFRRCGAREVVVGYDFTFGAGRRGDAALLRELGRRAGVTVHIVPPVSVEGGMVPSSTRVRQLVLEGRVGAAKLLLGRPHSVGGRVVTGDGRGRTIGFPTANVRTDDRVLLPANGVYAAYARIEGEPREWMAAANIGTNPTFTSDCERRLEVHILGYEGASLVGRRLRVSFVERLRSERRFASKEELVGRIEEDVAATVSVLGALGEATPGE